MIRKTAIAGLMLAFAAGCAPKAPDGPTPEEAAALAATERLMGMETCADAAASAPVVDELTPCRIDLGEGRPRLVVTSTPMADGPEGLTGTTRVEVAGEGGASLQVIEETALTTYTYPYTEDLSGDGAPDILVPLFTGNVNTAYAVWLSSADGKYVRAGELGGVSITTLPNGMIAASGRSNASEWETGYFEIKENMLVEVAAVVTRPDPEPGEPARTLPECEVIRVQAGVDPAPFCGPDFGMPRPSP